MPANPNKVVPVEHWTRITVESTGQRIMVVKTVTRVHRSGGTQGPPGPPGQDSSTWAGLSAGSGNAYVVAPDPSPALTEGLAYTWQADRANTGACTLDAGDGSGPHALQFGDQAIASGQIVTDQALTTIWDGAAWQLMGGGGGAASPVFTAINQDSVTLHPGQPVQVYSTGSGVTRAVGTAGHHTIGLVTVATDAGFQTPYQTEGPLTLADWTAVTGTVTLAAKARYFLDPVTPGMLTLVPPVSGSGKILQGVAWSLSPDTLDIQIEPPFLRA